VDRGIGTLGRIARVGGGGAVESSLVLPRPIAVGARDAGVGDGLAGAAGLPRRLAEWRAPGDRVLAAVIARLPAVPLAPSTIVLAWGGSSALAAAVLLLSIMRLASQARKCADAPLLG
jgi:hypothetical protein